MTCPNPDCRSARPRVTHARRKGGVRIRYYHCPCGCRFVVSVSEKLLRVTMPAVALHPGIDTPAGNPTA